MPIINMCDEAIAEATRNFTGGDDLYGLYLMTMADYDLDEFLRKVEIVKRNKDANLKQKRGI